ncbi:succinyltransferase [Corynebacterium canis]|uniref:Succinyltransferase n=1 Tax=Corynebacterium canis TaxID=679663 RepID=A0A5C5UG07_9CORY|nr:DapH/DapD/GlmU-related protein [Corynebacterium canis]TWT24986.1 succinyltransferase [Corynebacterium canis]WJY74876.1 2,3,4,5-tetrahydropyridine-2,6-dicarboxylate N-succinyltransferase [Corynebacterium canis]
MTIQGLHGVGAHAVGIANIAMDGTVLDTWFPHPELSTGISHTGSTRLGAQDLSPKMLSLVKLDEDRMVEQVAIKTSIASLAQPPVDAHDAYLRLHLLSHRMVRPHEINVEGIMDRLATVVWTNKGPCLPDNFEFVRTSLRSRGLIHVYGIDRLPRMVDYVVPTGVHIAEAERVRLGAYLSPGTSVMREGFVSFNSGTLGPAKVEGRLSSGVVIGEGTKIGLSATIMCQRTPEGGRIPLVIGENCTFGVSSGVIGISLGNNCHVGNNVIVEPDTLLYFAARDELGPAARIAEQHNWQLRIEPGFREVVARRM